MLAVTVTMMAQANVYFTKDISAESLQKIYEVLGVPATGRVAVKISTGESQNSNQLKPSLIQAFVNGVDGTLVECNTTYSGSRSTTASHRQAIQQRGYTVAGGFKYELDLMDSDGADSAAGELELPMSADTQNGVAPHFPYAVVGAHMANYDFMINLAHFKGHQMGGFGGVLKNQSIGMSARRGKALIHSAGRNTISERWFSYADDQDGFLESMAEVANAIHQYFHQEGKNIIYIDVMNNISVDCDCNGRPASPQMKDVGILASTDPVALDQACLDFVNMPSSAGDNHQPLLDRIARQHGTHIIDHAERIGLGSRSYTLIDLADLTGIQLISSQAMPQSYNIFRIDGTPVGTNMKSLDALSEGLYIINGKKVAIK